MEEKAYRSPVEMTVEEALGLENAGDMPDSSETDFGVKDLLDMHREAEAMIKDIDAKLEEFILEYETGKRSDREPVESIYDMKIYLLSSMARLFNPMSSYGKKKLKEAIKCREEFETLVGPMVSRITPSNFDVFGSVINDDLMEDIKTTRRQALGALRTMDGTTYGVAAVAWHIDGVPGEEKGVLRIDWLYVNEKFRGRNLADFLLGELVALCNESGIEHISVDFSTDSESKQRLAEIFGMWQFFFDAGLDPDIYIRTGDVTNLRRIGEYKKGVKSLSSLDVRTGSRLVAGFFTKTGYKGYLVSGRLPKDYIDMGLSYYIGTPDDCWGLLLAHRAPLGMLRVEYLDCAPGHEEDVGKLVSAFLGKSLTGYDDNNIMFLSPDFPEVPEFVNKLCPNQLGQYIVEGLLSKPDDDLDEEDIKKLLETVK